MLAFKAQGHYFGGMIMTGTTVNAAAIVCGSLVGVKGGHLLSEKVRGTIMAGLGLAVLLIGAQLALKSNQVMIVIGSLIGGGVIGELLGIEARLEAIGELLGSRFKGSGKVAEGFVTATLLYCVGAMAIMGSLQDGLGGRPEILYAKAALDGIASVALASTLGIGVLFSALPLFAYQGGITLCATAAQQILTPPVVQEMNAVGGLLIVAIAFDMLGVKRLPVGNLLPAVFLAPPLLMIFASP
ncbi:membrane protein [Geomonas sp. Red276]